jgi:hypothetical protein
VALGACLGAPAMAQQAPITGDFLIRQEWNDDFFATPDVTPAKRTRFRLRPRFEVAANVLRLTVGGDFNWSTDDNLKPKDITLPLNIIRDNYDSRSARLDLASIGLNLTTKIRAEVGRIAMPMRLTEMIWDRDLRVQGVTADWVVHQGQAVEPIVRLSGVYSRGSHVFGDSEEIDGSSVGKGTTLSAGAIDLGFGTNRRVEFTAAYLKFDHLEHLERMIRRQNTRVAGGPPVREFEVMDLVVRLRTDAPFPMQLVLDGSRNRKAPDQRDGIWASLVLGSLKEMRFRGEYTYAKVDKDATVAAYAADDFFWTTGWLGHRAEFAFAQNERTTVHLIGQIQQFKDAPNVAERSHWVKRLRIEARRTF